MVHNLDLDFPPPSFSQLIAAPAVAGSCDADNALCMLRC